MGENRLIEFDTDAVIRDMKHHNIEFNLRVTCEKKNHEKEPKNHCQMMRCRNEGFENKL